MYFDVLQLLYKNPSL